jgi:AraC family transcriptional regulator
MENLEKGRFFGISKKQFNLNGLTIVDSEFALYTDCPWHYHHNAHFALTTKGNLVETHRTEQFQLSAGSLLYNHSQEPHCNSKYSDLVSALHIDIDARWFKMYDFNPSRIEGVHLIRDPIIKNIFHRLFIEVRSFDNASNLSIESMVLQSVAKISQAKDIESSGKPEWVRKTKDLLYDRYNENLSLRDIALAINLHPGYLCQQFPIHFHCNFGDFIRKIKIEKAIQLILCQPQLSLTGIAYSCGFSDQSHFIRLFKKNTGITPLAFRRMIKV